MPRRFFSCGKFGVRSSSRFEKNGEPTLGLHCFQYIVIILTRKVYVLINTADIKNSILGRCKDIVIHIVATKIKLMGSEESGMQNMYEI